MAAIDVRGLQRRLELIPAEAAQAAGAAQQAFRLFDHRPVPPRRILLGERNVFAVVGAPGPPPCFDVEDEGQESESFRLGR
jgi:hypothetical protein